MLTAFDLIAILLARLMVTFAWIKSSLHRATPLDRSPCHGTGAPRCLSSGLNWPSPMSSFTSFLNDACCACCVRLASPPEPLC